jgi:hypothetical protein
MLIGQPLLDARIELINIKKKLKESDTIILRSIEDLIIALVKKGVIEKDDLPAIVFENILVRRKLREKMKLINDLLGKDPATDYFKKTLSE